MSTFFVEILFVWIAFIVGVYQDNLRDIIKAILSGNFTGAVAGMSASGTFIALGFLLGISVIIFFIRRKEIKEQKEAKIVQQAIAKKLGIDPAEELAKFKQVRKRA
ncbi:MAG: hypothetical protein HYX91_03560 [Chloroflexi bacterium]|nr:hypothetical protein [Chloroflexota bacterium]